MSTRDQGAPDYLTPALARLREATDEAGFDVREITLRFNEYDQTVELEARLVITAELLDDAPEHGGAIGAPRAQNQKVLSGDEN